MFYALRELEQTRTKIIRLLVKGNASNEEQKQMWRDLWFINGKLELGLSDQELIKLEQKLEMTG